jgi:hypothetical protein
VCSSDLGGEITDENSVWREDLEALLPAALNYSMMAGFFEQSNSEKDYEVPGSFVGHYLVDVDFTDRNNPFITLPKHPVVLPSDRAIRFIMSEKCDRIYNRMSDNMLASWDYYKGIIKDRFFQLEGKKVRLFNHPPLQKKCVIKMITSAEDILDTEHLPVPAGKEFLVIDELVKRFDKQRTSLTDKIIDKTDIN